MKSTGCNVLLLTKKIFIDTKTFCRDYNAYFLMHVLLCHVDRPFKM